MRAKHRKPKHRRPTLQQVARAAPAVTAVVKLLAALVSLVRSLMGH